MRLMKMKDHGKWLPYKPDKMPEGAPFNALFCKRESDGVDWYDYVNSGKNFAKGSIKLMAMYQDYHKSFVIGPAVTDPTMLFPANQIVREIVDYDGATDEEALIERFRNKLFDPKTEAITDQPPPPPVYDPAAEIFKVLQRLQKVEERIEQWFKTHPPS